MGVSVAPFFFEELGGADPLSLSFTAPSSRERPIRRVCAAFYIPLRGPPGDSTAHSAGPCRNEPLAARKGGLVEPSLFINDAVYVL